MGVRGLQSYLEKYCPDCCYDVNIPLLIQRTYSAKGQPVIVVDGLAWIHTIYSGLDWIGGGQFNELVLKAQQFVDCFTHIGVRLVFYFDGYIEYSKIKTWTERRMESLNKSYHILDAASDLNYTTKMSVSDFILPSGVIQVCQDVLEMCHCEVRLSVMDCDCEIAQYAQRTSAFAILAQDSDFVILDAGGAHYLSLKLNLKTMKTRLYDRIGLAYQLKIDPSHLPLLGTLMGNDVIQSQDLKEFHLKLSNQKPSYNRVNLKQLVPKIAKFISNLSSCGLSISSQIKEISITVFGHPHRSGDLLTSLDSYKTCTSECEAKSNQNTSNDKNWTELLKMTKRKHMRSEFPSIIYNIMKDLLFRSSTTIEDYRKDDLPFAANLTLPIRQRMYGILLQEKKFPAMQNEHKIEEWCMTGPGSLNRANYVTAVPTHEHPGLKNLWSDNSRFESVRWKLFVLSVSPKLDVDEFRKLPHYLVLPTMILFLMLECLDDWEVDAVLATATTLKCFSVEQLKALPSDPVYTRGIRLSNLIMQTRYILLTLVAACGYPLSKLEMAPWKYFDGKLFQFKYSYAKRGVSHLQLCDRLDDVLIDFNQARKILAQYCDLH